MLFRASMFGLSTLVVPPVDSNVHKQITHQRLGAQSLAAPARKVPCLDLTPCFLSSLTIII